MASIMLPSLSDCQALFLDSAMRKCPPDPGRGGQGTGGFEESGPSIPPGAEKLLGVLFDSYREIQVPSDPVRSGVSLFPETEAGAGPDARRDGYQQFLLLAVSLNGDRFLGAGARLG